MEVGVIAAMKEQLWACREKMVEVPKAHHCNRCSANEQVRNHCESAWAAHWFFKIQKYIVGRHSSGSDFGRIREIIQGASILGMNSDCRDKTIAAVVSESGVWKMEADIVAEAVKLLMVDTAIIDGPDGVKDIERVYESEQSTQDTFYLDSYIICFECTYGGYMIDDTKAAGYYSCYDRGI